MPLDPDGSYPDYLTCLSFGRDDRGPPRPPAGRGPELGRGDHHREPEGLRGANDPLPGGDRHRPRDQGRARRPAGRAP
ncbi:hypothetical protein ACU686_14885 [Yinghuangia aomiensis]